MAQWKRMCLPMQEKQEIRVRSPSQEDLLEEEMATDSGILAWKNSMDKGAWWSTVHRVPEESDTAEHTCT